MKLGKFRQSDRAGNTASSQHQTVDSEGEPSAVTGKTFQLLNTVLGSLISALSHNCAQKPSGAQFSQVKEEFPQLAAI
ncbi:hypothetical protein Pcinc_000837 [Petrolisthes cinctipes]|uniref:Uncharacterized protein n=1 Tax=Petrolisthes cinctipes TaxID=88211 RepID=A0AAE1GP38_PETCI|nr:hypothetical protein Pcinc_000837 [Petrolisthes cinctipes]